MYKFEQEKLIDYDQLDADFKRISGLTIEEPNKALENIASWYDKFIEELGNQKFLEILDHWVRNYGRLFGNANALNFLKDKLNKVQLENLATDHINIFPKALLEYIDNFRLIYADDQIEARLRHSSFIDLLLLRGKIRHLDLDIPEILETHMQQAPLSSLLMTFAHTNMKNLKTSEEQEELQLIRRAALRSVFETPVKKIWERL